MKGAPVGVDAGVAPGFGRESRPRAEEPVANVVGLCRAGDLSAWRLLYERHVPLVYRVARRLGVPEADFADLCQEVFLRVFRGLGSFRGEAQFATWLYRIVVHEVARAGRARTVRAALLSLIGRPDPPAVPDAQLEQARAGVELEAILMRLKPKQRQVFVLYELEELSLARIAEVLECPVETVKSRLRLARAEFSRLGRKRLAQEIDGSAAAPVGSDCREGRP